MRLKEVCKSRARKNLMEIRIDRIESIGGLDFMTSFKMIIAIRSIIIRCLSKEEEKNSSWTENKLGLIPPLGVVVWTVNVCVVVVVVHILFSSLIFVCRFITHTHNVHRIKYIYLCIGWRFPLFSVSCHHFLSFSCVIVVWKYLHAGFRFTFSASSFSSSFVVTSVLLVFRVAGRCCWWCVLTVLLLLLLPRLSGIL